MPSCQFLSSAHRSANDVMEHWPISRDRLNKLGFLVLLWSSLSGSAASGQTIGIWTSREELQAAPMHGPGWEAVWDAAQQSVAHPNVGDQEDRSNTQVLAAAIVYARTGDDRYRYKVVRAIEQLTAGGKPSGRTLAWARETGAYVMAADLVEYRTPEFESWLRNVSDVWVGDDNRTLRRMFHQRPNNWGMHAFGSLCAIDWYLGDLDSLRSLREYWSQGVEGPNPGFRYGDDLSWHADPADLRLINPSGARIAEFSVDGIVPDDMRRGGRFSVPPVTTGYVWEVMQGQVMAARILERAGMPIWQVGDRALYRAAYALEERLGGEWAATGDDQWMLAFLDDAYGTRWSHGRDVWGHGKNTGWAYVLNKR